MAIRVVLVAYLAVIVALTVFLDQNLILIALLLFFNASLLFHYGTSAIRSLVFPYSNPLIKNGFASEQGSKYALEFSGLLDKCYVILRLQSNSTQKVKNKGHFGKTRTNYTTREIASKLKSLYELLELYVDINKMVMDEDSK